MALKNQNNVLTKEQTDEIIKEVDYLGNGKINYSEFLAATFDITEFLNSKEGDKKLRSIFQQFDTDNTGFISGRNIEHAMEKLGRSVSKTEIESIMKAHNTSSSGRLGFEEFSQIFNQEGKKV